ncbi:MAG TPA: DUF4012 domain-containing protein, partial [Ilumatobacteraceae bacterium]
PASAGYWANVTMSPDLATDASVMSQMYAGAGRGQVDGVFVLDPSALSSMLRVSGQVTVPGINEPVTADALLTFLLVDQFTLDPATRTTVVNAVAGITLNQFLAASLPPAQQLAGDLGPAATEGHISAWARRSEEEGLLQLVGMADELPAPAGRDGLAVTTNNLAGNDTDNFLQRSVAYTASYDAATGHVSGDVGITLHSSAPSSGYPDDVIGNSLGLAPGTNRTLLTVYTPLTVTGATIDGVTVTTTPGTELGWQTTTLQIDLAPGQTRVVHLTMAGTVSTHAYSFVWRPQPMAHDDQLSVSVTSADGSRRATFNGVLPRLSTIDADGHRALH